MAGIICNICVFTSPSVPLCWSWTGDIKYQGDICDANFLCFPLIKKYLILCLSSTILLFQSISWLRMHMSACFMKNDALYGIYFRTLKLKAKFSPFFCSYFLHLTMGMISSVFLILIVLLHVINFFAQICNANILLSQWERPNQDTSSYYAASTIFRALPCRLQRSLYGSCSGGSRASFRRHHALWSRADAKTVGWQAPIFG